MTTNTDLIGYFNDLSETYATNEYASFYTTNYMRRRLIKKVESFENKSILDIMSGKGENLKYISKHINTDITTIDFSSKMNEAARLNHRNEKIHQIEGDFFEINHKQESFDIVLCSFGIKTIEPEKLNSFAKKINHLLKPNGEVFILEIVKPKKTFNFKIAAIYLDIIVPKIFGNQFKTLFRYMSQHVSMNDLKLNLINEKIKIIEHKRTFDMYEIIHAKKNNSQGYGEKKHIHDRKLGGFNHFNFRS